MATSVPKLSRDERRAERELLDARKSGKAPKLVDPDGNELNPFVPSFIARAPWYADEGTGPSFKHQSSKKRQEVDAVEKLDTWYHRGHETATAPVTKFRKGACENCGAMTHKAKECLERPRKLGAKYTGKDVRPDERVVADEKLVHVRDFDGKRDRWNGYDPNSYVEVAESFEKLEKIKAELRPEADESEEEKYAEEADMPGQHREARMTVRNLRMREDTAKYLRKKDADRIYDPKTRSLKGEIQEEGFVRASQDPIHPKALETFAWQQNERGAALHLQANPSQAEFLYKESLKKQQEQQTATHIPASLLAHYGGENYLKPKPDALQCVEESENYVEYSATGKVIKGEEKPIPKSRYPEDVYINNHTSVWGSFWENGQWGYQCCRSLIKNSYCTGIQEPEQGATLNVVKAVAAPIRPVKHREEAPVFQRATDDVSEQEMELYHLKRIRTEDPMSSFHTNSNP